MMSNSGYHWLVAQYWSRSTGCFRKRALPGRLPCLPVVCLPRRLRHDPEQVVHGDLEELRHDDLRLIVLLVLCCPYVFEIAVRVEVELAMHSPASSPAAAQHAQP